MKRLLIVLVAALLGGCGHDVPDHDVIITSNCNGPTRVGRFHFEAFDFDTSCSDLESDCSVSVAQGQQISGDLEVLRLNLHMGGYDLSIVPPGRLASEFVVYNPDDPLISCGWYVDDDLHFVEGVGSRADCLSMAMCWAELEVRR